MVRSRTSDSSRIRVAPGPLSSNNLEQVMYTHGAQANSAFHPSGVGKTSTGLSAGVKAGCVHLCRVEGNTV